MEGSPQNIDVSLNSVNKKTRRRLSQRKMKRRRNPKMCRRSRRRRSNGPEGSRRPRNHEVERKVKALKKLVPHSSETLGLDELFSETADYILALEKRVKLMQIMVKVLSINASQVDGVPS